jgi:hypothetical protein
MAKKPAAPAQSLADAGLENYEVVEMNRTELKGAPYNPRVLGDHEAKKLKAALKRHGLVAPITWNKRTGNVVGGHQRLKMLDSLMKSSSYTLHVAVVDVDMPREKELNLLLNNQQAMGSFDLAALKDMLDDKEVTLEGAGFDVADVIHMFGDTAFDETREDDLRELAGKLGELASHYTAIQTRNQQKTTGESFLVFVFPDSDHVDALLAHMRAKDNRYQSGLHLMQVLGVDLPDQSSSGNQKSG